jgi:hypothetical protein
MGIVCSPLKTKFKSLGKSRGFVVLGAAKAVCHLYRVPLDLRVKNYGICLISWEVKDVLWASKSLDS